MFQVCEMTIYGINRDQDSKDIKLNKFIYLRASKIREIIYVSYWIIEYTPRVSKFLARSSGRERISKRREFNTTLRQSPKPIGRWKTNLEGENWLTLSGVIQGILTL